MPSRATARGYAVPRLPLRQPLERRQAVRDMMERLLVDRVDRHLRRAEQGGIIERPDLQDHGGQARTPRREVRATIGAELDIQAAALRKLRLLNAAEFR
jgi:hypothetical protein